MADIEQLIGLGLGSFLELLIEFLAVLKLYKALTARGLVDQGRHADDEVGHQHHEPSVRGRQQLALCLVGLDDVGRQRKEQCQLRDDDEQTVKARPTAADVEEEDGDAEEPRHVLSHGPIVKADGQRSQVDVHNKEGSDGQQAVGAVEEVEEGALRHQQQEGKGANEGEEAPLAGDEAGGDEERVVEDEEQHRQRQKGALAPRFLVARRREVGTHPRW